MQIHSSMTQPGSTVGPTVASYAPMVIQKEAGGGERVMDLPSRLLKDRVIMLVGEVNDAVAASIVQQLLFLNNEDPTKDIHFYINSPGGVVKNLKHILRRPSYIKTDCFFKIYHLFPLFL